MISRPGGCEQSPQVVLQLTCARSSMVTGTQHRGESAEVGQHSQGPGLGRLSSFSVTCWWGGGSCLSPSPAVQGCSDSRGVSQVIRSGCGNLPVQFAGTKVALVTQGSALYQLGWREEQCSRVGPGEPTGGFSQAGGGEAQGLAVAASWAVGVGRLCPEGSSQFCPEAQKSETGAERSGWWGWGWNLCSLQLLCGEPWLALPGRLQVQTKACS